MQGDVARTAVSVALLSLNYGQLEQNLQLDITRCHTDNYSLSRWQPLLCVLPQALVPICPI